jgi:hypothetical protein
MSDSSAPNWDKAVIAHERWEPDASWRGLKKSVMSLHDVMCGCERRCLHDSPSDRTWLLSCGSFQSNGKTMSTNRYPNNPGFVRGSQTSAEAASSIRPQGLEDKFLQAIRESMKGENPGLTEREITVLLNLPRRTKASPRLATLARKGFIYDSGRARINPETGRKQKVWFPSSYDNGDFPDTIHATAIERVRQPSSPPSPPPYKSGHGDEL